MHINNFDDYISYKSIVRIISLLFVFTVISKPRDAYTCEGKEAEFTCVLNGSIRSDDVQWYRFIKDTSATVLVDPNGDNINFVTETIGDTTSSTLTITNVIKSYTGYFFIRTPSLNNVCVASLTVLASKCLRMCMFISCTACHISSNI